jgi:fucose 4-O-acetylase-like acetyltransferase
VIEKNGIDYRFKILYAIGIIMVCCGHTNGGGISLLKDWFTYSGFHLALFVFCSGYFYKDIAEEAPRRYVYRKIKTLILPFYLYTIIYGVIVQFLKLAGFNIGKPFTLYNVLVAPITSGHQFAYNVGGWFVVPLFMVEMCNILMRRIIHALKGHTSEVFFFLISVLLGIAGNQLACQGYYRGWWLVLTRMLYFLPFYGLGIFYKRELEKYVNMVPSFWYFIGIFSIKLIIGLYYGRMMGYTPSWCNDFTEGPAMPILIGVLGIALWMRIATILEPVLGKSKWINLIADNTYSIMMNQFIGFMIVKTVYAMLNKYNVAFPDFDWTKYKNDMWWYYMPRGLTQTLILYVVNGIVFSIIVQKLIIMIKKVCEKSLTR